MGYVVQWGVPGDMTHVAIYINESHIINGNWDYKNPHAEDTTKSRALSELGTITGYHN